jgi:hypothetical protein
MEEEDDGVVDDESGGGEDGFGGSLDKESDMASVGRSPVASRNIISSVISRPTSASHIRPPTHRKVISPSEPKLTFDDSDSAIRRLNGAPQQHLEIAIPSSQYILFIQADPNLSRPYCSLIDIVALKPSASSSSRDNRLYDVQSVPDTGP